MPKEGAGGRQAAPPANPICSIPTAKAPAIPAASFPVIPTAIPADIPRPKPAPAACRRCA